MSRDGQGERRGDVQSQGLYKEIRRGLAAAAVVCAMLFAGAAPAEAPRGEIAAAPRIQIAAPALRFGRHVAFGAPLVGARLDKAANQEIARVTLARRRAPSPRVAPALMVDPILADPRRLPLTGLAAGGGGGGAGRAIPRERVPRGETVLSRRRPELEPLGVRVASFQVFPRVAVLETFNDNLLARASGADSDLISRIAPALNVRSDWGRHRLDFQVDLAYGRHVDHGNEDYLDGHVGGAGRLDLSRETQVSATLDYWRKHEARTSVDDAGGVEPTRFGLMAAKLGLDHDMGRFAVSLAGRYALYDYDDVDAVVGGVGRVIDNDDRDRDEVEGSARVGYEIVPGYEAFVRGGANRRAYATTPDNAGFDRDSHGVDVAGGIRLDLGGMIVGDFYAGWLAQDFDDPALGSIAGPVVGVDLTWTPTPLTTVTARVGRQVRETTFPGASGFLETAAAVAVDHELLRNLLLRFDLGYAQNKFEGVGRTDRDYEAGFGARYMMNRHVSLVARYEFRKRTSDVAALDFDRNLVMIGLEAQY